MKFLITESCLLKGEHLEAGTVLELAAKDAAAMLQSQRGHPVPDDYQSPAEIAAASAAEEAELEAAIKAEEEAKAKAEADEKAAAAKPAKHK